MKTESEKSAPSAEAQKEEVSKENLLRQAILPTEITGGEVVSVGSTEAFRRRMREWREG